MIYFRSQTCCVTIQFFRFAKFSHISLVVYPDWLTVAIPVIIHRLGKTGKDVCRICVGKLEYAPLVIYAVLVCFDAVCLCYRFVIYSCHQFNIGFGRVASLAIAQVWVKWPWNVCWYQLLPYYWWRIIIKSVPQSVWKLHFWDFAIYFKGQWIDGNKVGRPLCIRSLATQWGHTDVMI